MPRVGQPPSTVPYGAEQIVDLVIGGFGGLDTVHGETELERADNNGAFAGPPPRAFNDTNRVMPFTPLEQRAGASTDLAAEIQTDCDIEENAVPERAPHFANKHGGPTQRSRSSCHIRGAMGT
jgi:hypothetical protein